MIGRMIWFVALAAVGLVTAGLQLDKQAEVAPALAPMVPGPLRNFAQTRIAAVAADGADPLLAVAEAERLVRRRPVPAEYLSTLAVARAKAGQAEAAGITIQIAGQRGWRAPVAQEAVLRLALSAGDQAEAARRYAALFLRNTTPDALLQELGPEVFGTPDGPGQRTMADIVAGGERWHAHFLQRGPQVIPPAAFVAIATRAMDKGAAFDCDGLAQSISAVEQRQAGAAAPLSAAARKQCPTG